MENEIWKDIPSYRGFLQASNLGRIREYIIVKVNNHPDIIWKNRILNIGFSGNEFGLINYKSTTRNAGRLIAEAWFENFDRKHYVFYKDKNHKNLRPENLELGKSPVNSVHGYNNWQAKLNDEKILEIIQLIKDGYSAKKISVIYGIHFQNVYRIAYNKIWKHIKRPILDFRSAKAKIKRNKRIENQ